MTARKPDPFWDELDRVVDNFDKLAAAYAEGPSFKAQISHYRTEYENLAAQMRKLLGDKTEPKQPQSEADKPTLEAIADAARWVDGDLWNDKYPNLNRDSLNALHQAFKKADANQKP